MFDRVIAVIIAGLLLWATALVLEPFSGAILWGVVLAIAVAPIHSFFQKRLKRRRLSAAVTTILLAVVLVLPAVGLTRSIVTYTPGVVDWVQAASNDPTVTAPDSIRNIPWIGSFLSENWSFIATEIKSYVAHFSASIEEWLAWGLKQIENAGLFMFELALGVILAGVFLANRDRLGGAATIFARRVGGGPGLQLLDRAVVTTRSTVRGVVGSAIAEALVATFFYFIAGVPAWALLGGLTFFAALVQIGAPLVWVPVAVWLLVQNEPLWAIFMVVWGVVVVYSVENFSRPILAGKSAELPGLLIFVGVLGGLVAFGLIGVFLGPVILAVAFDLVKEWLRLERGGGGGRQSDTPAS